MRVDHGVGRINAQIHLRMLRRKFTKPRHQPARSKPHRRRERHALTPRLRLGATNGIDGLRKRIKAGVEHRIQLLAGMNKRLVILSARGAFGYGPGQRIAHLNHVEAGVATAFGYIGVTDVASVAIEYDEFADKRLRASIASAESEVDALVARMAAAVEAA